MELKVNKRKVKGRKTNNLRRKGIIPGVVYGPKRGSLDIELDVSEMEDVYIEAGYSKMIDLKIDDEKKECKVLIREMQNDPVTDEIIHVSFYEPDLKKQITASVPVKVKGISKAVKEKIGFLVTPFEQLEVRCLPSDLPDKLVVDISYLNEIGDSIPISELELPENVILTAEIDEHATIAYIAPPQKEIVEEVEEVEVTEEGEEGEDVEGEEVEGEEVEGVEGEEGEAKEGAEGTGEEKEETKGEGAKEQKK